MSVYVSNITVSYQRRPAVHHVSGRFECGVATAIVGPNGAGKSTLLKAIAGILPLDHGKVALSDCSPNEIAYLPQKAEIDLSMPMTVFELVATGLWRRMGAFVGMDEAGLARVEQALEQVGMQGFTARPLAALSIGQLQRVLFARILVQDAPVILLDEPFNAVDAKTTEVLLGLVHRWQEEQRTVIAVLHDFEQVKRYFQSALLLAHEVVAWGTPNEVLTAQNLMRANERCAHWFDEGEVCLTDEQLNVQAIYVEQLSHDHHTHDHHSHDHSHDDGHTHGEHAHTHSGGRV